MKGTHWINSQCILMVNNSFSIYILLISWSGIYIILFYINKNTITFNKLHIHQIMLMHQQNFQMRFYYFSSSSIFPSFIPFSIKCTAALSLIPQTNYVLQLLVISHSVLVWNRVIFPIPSIVCSPQHIMDNTLLSIHNEFISQIEKYKLNQSI